MGTVWPSRFAGQPSPSPFAIPTPTDSYTPNQVPFSHGSSTAASPLWVGGKLSARTQPETSSPSPPNDRRVIAMAWALHTRKLETASPHPDTPHCTTARICALKVERGRRSYLTNRDAACLVPPAQATSTHTRPKRIKHEHAYCLLSDSSPRN